VANPIPRTAQKDLSLVALARESPNRANLSVGPKSAGQANPISIAIASDSVGVVAASPNTGRESVVDFPAEVALDEFDSGLAIVGRAATWLDGIRLLQCS
jgi:hypothetical protein